MIEDTLALSGIHIRYQVEGKGPDLLFIHGWASSRRMWAHLSSSLASAYRCWAIDLPGFGDSDKPAEEWYSISNYTAIVSSFMQAAHMRAARIIGHSMGGMIAFDLAASHADQVERLVAINPVVTGRRTSLRPLAHWGPGQRLLHWTLRVSPRVLQPVLRHRLGDRLHHGVKYIRRRTEDFAKSTAGSLWSSGRAVLGHDLSPRLAHITAPTLIVVGDQDLTVSHHEGRFAAERVPGARLVVLRAGHLVTDDLPAETLGHVREFLA